MVTHSFHQPFEWKWLYSDNNRDFISIFHVWTRHWRCFRSNYICVIWDQVAMATRVYAGLTNLWRVFLICLHETGVKWLIVFRNAGTLLYIWMYGLKIHYTITRPAQGRLGRVCSFYDNVYPIYYKNKLHQYNFIIIHWSHYEKNIKLEL